MGGNGLELTDRVEQQLVRFVVERYRDELVTLIQGNVDEYQVAADRETIASDLLNILQRCIDSLLSFLERDADGHGDVADHTVCRYSRSQ